MSMDAADMPSKEQLRAWLRMRRFCHAPLPSIETLQAQIGWTKSGCAQEGAVATGESTARIDKRYAV